MSDPANRESLERLLDSDVLRRVLEKAYLEVESGLEPDWLGLAEGDVEVASLARTVAVGAARTSASLAGSGYRAEPRQDGPERIGEYEIVDVLGVGGMSRVYLAHQTSLDRLVALKVLDPELAADPSRRARFRREAEITASLEHPAIVPIYGVGEDEGRSFIAMKLLDGLDLEAVERLFSPREAASLGLVVAEALHTAHLAGVIHRDVKPSNIILEGGAPILLDFGLAWAYSQREVTAADAAPGTLAYMSPEQLEGGRGLDPRTDVFSLAATLHELVAGERLFGADSHGAVIARILHDPPSRLPIDRRDRDFETILLKALAKDRESRFSTAQEMADELRRFLDGTPIKSRRTSLAGRAVLAYRRNRRTAALAAILVVSVLVLAGTLSLQHWKQTEREVDLVRRVETELGAGRLESAAALVGGLDGKRHESLRRRIAGRIALEQLEDRVLDFGNLRDGDRLRRLLAESQIERAESSLDAATLLLDIEAAIMLDEGARARDLLDRHDALFGPGRASRAFRLLLEQGRIDSADDLPPPRADDGATALAMEHVHTCLAMDLGSAPTALRRSELDQAFRADPENFGARHLAGRLAFEEGDYGAATAHYRGLVRRDRLTDCAIRGLASCFLAQRRPESARLILDQLGDREAEPGVIRLRLEIAALEKSEDFDRLLAEARSIWPKEGEFLILAAARAFNRNETERVLSLVAEAEAMNLNSLGHARAAFLRLNCLVMPEMRQGGTQPLQPDDARRSKLVELKGRLDAAMNLIPRGFAIPMELRLMAIRADVLLGQGAKARAQLAPIVRDHPGVAAPVLFQALLVDAACKEVCARNESLPKDSPLRAELVPCITALERIADEAKGQERELAILVLVRLTSWAEDWAAFDHRVEQFDRECPTLANDANKRIVSALVGRSFRLR